MIKIEGIIPAITSPCDNKDNFIEDHFVKLARNLLAQGVHGLYVCGVTGDGYHMRLEERKRAAELALGIIKEFNRTLIVHIGCQNTRDALELSEHAAEIGVPVIASIPPANRTHKQLASYYKDIAQASQLPFLIYYAPALANTSLTLDEMLELLDIEGVIGMKYTDWNLHLIRRILMARPKTTILNGFDEILCLSLINGACGGVGTAYNLFPVLHLKMYEAVKQNNITKAMNLQNVYLSFVELLHKHGYRAVFEHLMRQRGYGERTFRRPHDDIDPNLFRKIEPELNARVSDIENEIKKQALVATEANYA